MMTKTEQNMLEMARASAQTYKEEAIRKTGILRNLEGFVKVTMSRPISDEEIELCKTILDYINFRNTNN